MNKFKKLFNLSLKEKEGITGYVFTLPFIVGFIFLFLLPFIQSIIFSVSELNLGQTGYDLEFVGLENFIYILMVDVNFIPIFIETVTQMLTDVPVILVFSFFAAVVLNQKFKGSFIFLLIFFFPVIYGAGVIIYLEEGDLAMEMYQGTASMSASQMTAGQELTLSVGYIEELLQNLQLPRYFVEYIINAIEHIAELIRASGIQILIFLSGLKSIPSSLYEAARVEGANGWQKFWFITFPMLSPLLLTNVVYSIIDSFTAANRNELMEFIDTVVFSGGGFGIGTAMSWLYLFSVFIFLGITFLIISKFVYYEE